MRSCSSCAVTWPSGCSANRPPMPAPQEAMEAYLATRGSAHDRLTRFMSSLAIDGVDDVASVIVAIRQIRALVG